MTEVDAIFRRLRDKEDLGEIRIEIADLIIRCLSTLQNRFGYWEKAHIAHAIANLSRNMSSNHQPTNAWLNLCLVTIEKAMVPSGERNDHYTPRDTQLDAFSWEQLMEEIQQVRAGG
jgi:hypothetical protein